MNADNTSEDSQTINSVPVKGKEEDDTSEEDNLKCICTSWSVPQVQDRILHVMGDADRMMRLASDFIEEATSILFSSIATDEERLTASLMVDEAEGLITLASKTEASNQSLDEIDEKFVDLSELVKAHAYRILEAYRVTAPYPNIQPRVGKDKTNSLFTYQVIVFEEEEQTGEKFQIVVPQSIRPFEITQKEDPHIPEPGEKRPIYLPYAYFLTFHDGYIRYMC